MAVAYLPGVLVLFAAAASVSVAEPIRITVDLTDAPRKFMRAQMIIPVHPGPLTLVYAKWIPGEHGPTGPIENFTGITFTANGQSLAWRRDDVNMFAFHLVVPEGVQTSRGEDGFPCYGGAVRFFGGRVHQSKPGGLELE